MQHRGLSRALGVALCGGATAALVGWWASLPVLTAPRPDLAAIKPNAAACLFLLGAALVASGIVRRSLALVVAAVGALTTLEWATGVDLGIDGALFAEGAGAPGTGVPSRISLPAALAFVALGLGLLGAEGRGDRARAGQLLAVAGGTVGLFSVAGYAYDAWPLYQIAGANAVPLYAAVGLVLAAAGVVLARREVGLSGLLASAGPGGVLVRWVLLLLVPLPILLDASIGLLNPDAGSQDALHSVAVSVAFGALAVYMAHRIERAESVRRDIAVRLAAQEARYRSLFEHMSSGFALFRLVYEDDQAVDCELVEANRAFAAHAGRSAEELLGRRASNRCPHFDRRWLDRYDRVAKTGEDACFEEGSALSGRHLSVSAFRPSAGHVAIVVVDVTERKRHEEQILALNRELEAFSYSVSHDLRAPLRAVSGLCGAALEDCGDRIGDEGRGFLKMAVQAAGELEVLIEELLQLAKVNRAELHREHVAVTPLAHALLDDLRRGALLGRDVAVSIEEGLEVEGDFTLVRIALQNLLQNAAKFTSRNASARIEVGRAVSRGRSVLFVRDDGVGFDMTYVRKLFRPFQRLHRSDEFPGTGVGLATVMRIVQRHGGDAWAEGAPGRGASFYFTFEPGISDHDALHPPCGGQPPRRADDAAGLPAGQHRQ